MIFPRNPNTRLLARYVLRVPASIPLTSAQVSGGARYASSNAHVYGIRKQGIRQAPWRSIPAIRIPSVAQMSTTCSIPDREQTVVQLPNHQLLARSFHRRTLSSPSQVRGLSSSGVRAKWEGRSAEENTTREKDSHNVQQDAVKEGKQKRAEGEGGAATSQKGGEANKKAEGEFKEAPKPVIGMNDERGSKG